MIRYEIIYDLYQFDTALDYFYHLLYHFRHLKMPKGVRDEDTQFVNRIWIKDAESGYRLCTILDDGLYDTLVGFRDEQGFFEKVFFF